jgi:hypothetical protein
MADEMTKVYCYDKPADNSAMWAALMSNRDKGVSPETLMAMNGGGGFGGNGWNNPFMYLIWLAMFNGNGFGFGNNAGNAMQNNELMNQINSLRQQIGDNQLNNVAMDAIKGNQNAIANLATSLNCNFNQLSTALCNVRSAIEQVGGQVGFTSERVINAVGMGDAAITSKLQECCCGMKTAVLEQGYQNQLALERQTNTLGRDIEVSQAQSQLQNCQNTAAVTQAITSLGHQLQQHKCEVVESGTANTQRILDALNNHWQSETALALQDEKFKNSQLMQNQFIASLINGQAAATRTTSVPTT